MPEPFTPVSPSPGWWGFGVENREQGLENRSLAEGFLCPRTLGFWVRGGLESPEGLRDQRSPASHHIRISELNSWLWAILSHTCHACGLVHVIERHQIRWLSIWLPVCFLVLLWWSLNGWFSRRERWPGIGIEQVEGAPVLEVCMTSACPWQNLQVSRSSKRLNILRRREDADMSTCMAICHLLRYQ